MQCLTCPKKGIKEGIITLRARLQQFSNNLRLRQQTYSRTVVSILVKCQTANWAFVIGQGLQEALQPCKEVKLGLHASAALQPELHQIYHTAAMSLSCPQHSSIF